MKLLFALWLVTILASSACRAVDSSSTQDKSYQDSRIGSSGQISSNTQMHSNDKYKAQDRDSSILGLLEQRLTMSEFAQLMEEHARNLSTLYEPTHISDLWKMFAARDSFGEPCKMDSLNVLTNAYTRYALFSSNFELKKIMNHLVNDEPSERYAVKCADEFDELARQVFAQDARALQEASKLSRLISDESRKQMKYESVEEDLLSAKRSDLTSGFDATICERVNQDAKVRATFVMLQKILGPVTSLRPIRLIRRLASQVGDEEPNTVKLLALVTYCKLTSAEFQANPDK